MQRAKPPPLLQAYRHPQQRRRWLRYWLWDVLQGMLQMSLYAIMRWLPIDLLSALGGLLGKLLGPVGVAHYWQRSAENLRAFHPEWTDLQIQQARRRLWDNLGRIHAEFSLLDRLIAQQRINIHNPQHARLALSHPVIFMCLHTGNWEVMGPATTHLGIDNHAIVDPPENRFTAAIARHARTRYGMKLIPPGRGAMPRVVRLLKQGGSCSFFCDEEARGIINAPFFSRKAHTRGNLAFIVRLAKLTGALIVPCWCTRLHGCRFEVRYASPITLSAAENGQAGLLQNVVQLNAFIEPIIRQHLDQWYWLPGYRPLPPPD
jgi:KDO2-lipid IV(A) lauroyltransferase